jgi:hypothetical protein
VLMNEARPFQRQVGEQERDNAEGASEMPRSD